MKPSRLCCVGSAIIDITATPIHLNTLAKEHVRADQTLIASGGCAGNVSLCLASLGVELDLLARIGAGPMGDLVERLLIEGGVGHDLLIRDPQRDTGKTIVLVQADGDRRFIYTPGANAALCESDFQSLDLSQYRALHISDVFLLPHLTHGPFAKLLKLAQSQGLLTSMDTVWDPSGKWLEVVEPCFPYLDIFSCSHEEAAHLYPDKSPQEIVATIHQAGVKTVILKLGPEGSLLYEGDGLHPIAAVDVPKVVDTTGAGDAYAAAFVAGRLQGMSSLAAANAASHFAAHTIQSLGATSNLKSWGSVEGFLQ